MNPRLIGLTLIAVAAPLVAGEWPLHRGDATQTGVSDEKLPDQLAARWEYKAGRSVEGTAVIADGVVYVGSIDKLLHAIDLKTGQAKWKAPIGSTTASPGVHGDRVYIGDDDGKFYCFSRANGQLIWAFETEGPGMITAGPNFAGDLILIPAHDSTLYCLNKDGKKVWDFKIEGPIYGGVAVADGKTFLAGCDSLMHVIDIKTGKEQGSVDLKGQSGSAAAVVGEHLYVGTMSNQVLAINLRRLRIDWEFEAPKRKQGFYASAAVTNDLVVIGSRDNRVWAIDRKTGKSRWDFLTDHKVDGSAVIASGKVYVGSFDQKFYVLDLNGKKVQDFALDGAIIGSPAVAGGCVVIGTDKGTVYCLGAKD
jgi:outer membrane protein assembly factor BamB